MRRGLLLRLISLSRAGFAGARRQGRAQPRQLTRLSDLAIAKGAQHLEHLAPGREGAAVFALVLIHGPHEGDFVVSVIAFTRSRIDLPTAFALVAALLAAAAVDGNGNAPLAAVIAPAVG